MAVENEQSLISPYLFHGRLPSRLAAHLFQEDERWADLFQAYLCKFGSAPNVSYQEPFWGKWLESLRNSKPHQTPERLLSLHCVKGFSSDLRWLPIWKAFAGIVQHGEIYHHTCISTQDPLLGISIKNLRQSRQAALGNILPVLNKWWPWYEQLLMDGMPGWAHQMPRVSRMHRDAFINSLKVQTFTAEHRAMQYWAKAYTVRSQGIPFFLLTPEELLAELGQKTTAWLAGLTDNPDKVAAMPEYMRYALAQLMLAPPVEIWPEPLPGNLLPDGCIGLVTQQLAHLRNLSLHYIYRPTL
jgi:hypothetical protein